MEDQIDRTIVRIKKSLGRLLRWIGNARGADFGRPALTLFRLEEREGPFGQGVVMATDGLRIHLATNVNKKAEEDEMPWEYQEHLDLDPGLYNPYARLEAKDHINEMWAYDAKFPDTSSIPCFKMRKAKPVINLAINPRYLAEAVQNAAPGQAVYIRIYQGEDQVESDDISVLHPIEIISQDKDLEDVVRMAVIMPMHLGFNQSLKEQANEGLCRNFPVAWTGKFPPQKKEGEE